MKNIDVSKLTHLLETKKQTKPNPNPNSTNNNIQIKPSHPPYNNNHRFKVQSFPKEKFPLFDKRDFYHYDKKFHLDLPKVITPPISFHFPSSNENFSSFDMMTMLFELKKNQEILTDPKLNTNIHKDFIDNSLNLIFPENFEKNKFKDIREDVLKIIESREDINNGNISKNKSIKSYTSNNSSFYLRRSTLISSTLSLKKNNEKNAFYPQNGVQNLGQNNQNKNLNMANLANLKKVIENSFSQVKNIKEGFEHPHKKNVTAKNVYEILPFHELSDLKFNQIIFPNDPIQDIHQEEMDRNFLIPDQFVLKRSTEDDIDIYALFKEDKIINENIDKQNFNKNKITLPATYFTYERDFQISSSSNQSELFNRYFIFMENNANNENKKNTLKSAKFLPIDSKFFLKKYKKIHPIIEDDENNYNPNNVLNKKRERDLILIPKNVNYDLINLNNKNFKSVGANLVQSEVEVEANWNNVNLNRERILNRTEEKMDVYEEEEDNMPNEEGEDVDLFEFGDSEHEENDNFIDDENNLSDI